MDEARARSVTPGNLFMQRLLPADVLRIRGLHNACNALAALALAQAAGCPLAPLLFGLREYRGEPHRVQSLGLGRWRESTSTIARAPMWGPPWPR